MLRVAGEKGSASKGAGQAEARLWWERPVDRGNELGSCPKDNEKV